MRDRNCCDYSLQSEGVSARGRGLVSLWRLVAVLVACWFLAPSVFAGGGIGGLCPDGPCVELVAVAINGNPITPTSNVTVQPGDEIEANLFVSGWGEAIGLLKTYQVSIGWISPSESGTRGTVLPLGLHEPRGDPQRAAQIDAAREDYVFFGKATAFGFGAFDGISQVYAFEAAVNDAGERVADDGVPRYAGTFRLVASAFACGEFSYSEAPRRTLRNANTGAGFVAAGFAGLRIGIGDGSCDCNANGIDDFEEIASGSATDCNGNSAPDECEPDCQPNGIADECDISDGTSIDCDFDVIPDECEAMTDCNDNGIRDECEVVGPNSFDCNGNGIPDDCDGGTDCNGNGTLDSCDLANDTSIDCQSNGVPDECDVASGFSRDDDGNGIPDECETFCAQSECGPGSCVSLKAVAINGNPIEPTSNVTAARGDVIETEIWLSCWGADVGLLRGSQVVLKGRAGVVSGEAGLVLPVGWDAPLALIPCDSNLDCPEETTCAPTGTCDGPGHFPRIGAFIDSERSDFVLRGFDVLFFVGSTTLDYEFVSLSQEMTGATDTGVPNYGGTLLLSVSDDACGEFTFDFVTNGSDRSEFVSLDNITVVTPDTQPLFIQTHDCDCNDNGVVDDEELASGAAADCNRNDLPDDCDPDCDGDGIPDDCQLADCNGDRACGDCNRNGIPDGCDIASGTSADVDGNGVPDDCFLPIPTVSEWGLAVLAILLLVVAKLRFGFARSHVA